MLCDNCGKNEATIKYTQVINGRKKEMNLCKNCAENLGIEKMEMPLMNFRSILGDFFNDYAKSTSFGLPNFRRDTLTCKNCGTSYEDFINTGLFGCEKCYNTFSEPIDLLLKNLHGTSRHIGRGPKKLSKFSGKNENKDIKINEENTKEKQEKNQESQKEKLQKDLDQAIKEERYEDAAKIRDELKKLK